jgi:hypothetical protein
MSSNINPPTKKSTGQLKRGETCTKCSNPADSENGSLLCRDHDMRARMEATQLEREFAIPQPTDAQENQKSRSRFTAEPSKHDTKRPNCSINGCEEPSSSASFLCPFHLDYFSTPTTEELGIAHCQYPNCTFFWTEKKLLPQGIKLFCEWHAPEEPVYDPTNPQSRPPASPEPCKACPGPLLLLSNEELCGYCWRIQFGSDPKKGPTASSLGQDHHQSQQQATPGKSHELAHFEAIPRSCYQLPQKVAQVQQQQQQPHFSRDRTTIPPKTHQLVPLLQRQTQKSSRQPPNNDGSQHYEEQLQALVAQPPQREHMKKTYGQNELQRLPGQRPQQSSKEMQMERGRQLHSTVPYKETHRQKVQEDHQQSPFSGFHGYFGQQQHRDGSDEVTGKQQTRQPPSRNAEKLDLEREKSPHRDLLLKKPQQELSRLSQEQLQEEEHKMDQVQHDAEQLSPAENHAKFWDDYPACKCEGRRLVADTWQTEEHWTKCPLNLSSIPHSEKTFSIYDDRKKWKTWAKRQIYSVENPGVRFCSGSMRESCMEPLDPKSRYKNCDECRKIH